MNAGLTSPLEFVQEFLSIQTVRNSLEHRNGIVGKQDLDDGGSTLTLTFPRWKFFYMRGEEEIDRGHSATRRRDRNASPSASIGIGSRIRVGAARC